MTNHQTLTNYSPYDVNEQQNLEARIRALESSRGSTVWWNPSTGNFHHDPTNSLNPNYDGPIMANSYELQRNRGTLKGASALSSAERDMLQYRHISAEYQDRYLQLYDTWDMLIKTGRTKAAGVLTMQSHPELANQIISQETLDLTVRDFSLEGNATETRTATTIEVALPNRITGNLWSTGLGPHDITDTVNISYAVATTTLEKAQVHVASSIWIDMVERRRNVVADTLNQARKEEPRVMEDKIASTLAGFADVAVTGGAFDIIAAGAYHHTHDPTKTFFSVQDTIAAAGGETNVLAMNQKTAQVLFGNTWMSVAGPLQTAQNVVTSTSTSGRVLTHPKLPGYMIVISRKLADGIIFQYQKNTVWSITGPQRTGTYEKNPGYVEGTIIDKFYGCAIIESTLGKEITGAL